MCYTCSLTSGTDHAAHWTPHLYMLNPAQTLTIFFLQKCFYMATSHAVSTTTRRQYPDEFYTPDVLEEDDIWTTNVCPYAKVALLGDSIIKYIDGLNNTQVVAYKGIKTEQLALRIIQGKIPHLPDKQMVVLHVGTNNIQNDSPELMFTKLCFLVDAVRDKLPSSIVVVSLILPRPIDHHFRAQKVKDYNFMVQNRAADIQIRCVSSYRDFLYNSTPISHFYAKDNIHLLPPGTACLQAYLNRTLGRFKAEANIKRTKRSPPSTIIMEKIKGQGKRFKKY